MDSRTIERYVETDKEELESNGYCVLKGQKLKEFIEIYNSNNVTDINVGNIPKKTPKLGVFNIKSILNLAMLLKESKKAESLRQLILDISIDYINRKTGGNTKYINQRDEEFLNSWFEEENYRKQFTDSLKKYVVEGKYKYATYTDKIYISIFKEHAKEYKKLLDLKENEKARDTFYSEILDLVASYECGLADEIKSKYESKKERLTYLDLDNIFKEFENKLLWKPLINKARTKMASRDNAFRDVKHNNLEEYIKPLPKDEFERFLGEKSKAIEERIKDAEKILKRLKDR